MFNNAPNFQCWHIQLVVELWIQTMGSADQSARIKVRVINDETIQFFICIFSTDFGMDYGSLMKPAAAAAARVAVTAWLNVIWLL